MNYETKIEYWKKYLGITDWKISFESINHEQVDIDEDIPEEDRYFIGISRNYETKRGIIYYDRPMTEEDILHELLHVRYPEFSEDEVNTECDRLLKLKIPVGENILFSEIGETTQIRKFG